MPHLVEQNAKMSLEARVGNELIQLIFMRYDLRPKPCGGTAIQKGELRVGTQVDFRGNTTFAWRHWGCLTPQIIGNMKKSIDNADDIDGFDELKDEDKERVRKAWEAGHVAEEDIPESATKVVAGDEADEPKKRKRAPPKKKAKKDEDEGEDDDDDEKPKKKAPKKAPAKKAPAKKKPTKKKKDESDQSGEDFGDEINQVSGDDDYDGDDAAETGKKRKRDSSKKASGSKKSPPKAKAASRAKKPSDKKKAVSDEEMDGDE